MQIELITIGGAWTLKGDPAPGPKEGEKVTALYSCFNINGVPAYRLKQYPGFAFSKTNFKTITP